MSITFLQLLVEVIFLTVVYLHLSKKNFGAVIAYGIQSFALAILLLNSFFETGYLPLLLVAVLASIVKVVFAPLFFVGLIKKHELRFAVSTYLSTPITLIILAAITAIANSQKFAPFTGIIPAHQTLLSFALSAMFLSLFLIINRKGALSQIIGILSFENCMVTFAMFAGLEQSPGLQTGIIFDVFIWIIIAKIFISMIHKHFGSLDTTAMKHLKD